MFCFGDLRKIFDTLFLSRLPVKIWKQKNFSISKKKIVSILRYFLTEITIKVKIGYNYSETEYILWCSWGFCCF